MRAQAEVGWHQKALLPELPPSACKAPAPGLLANFISPGDAVIFPRYTSSSMAARSERYSTHLRCGEGFELRFTRLPELREGSSWGIPGRAETSDPIHRFSTLMRVRAPGADDFTPPLLLPDAPSGSNAGFACPGKGSETRANATTFRIFGGAFRSGHQGTGSVEYAEGLVWVSNHTASVEWTQARTQVLNLTLAAELNCSSGMNEICELDGKISLARFRDRTLMFVRENPNPSGGGRHVQVASSADGVTGWSSFLRLDFDGMEVPHKENNIYYLDVQPFQLANGTEGLLGLMPANLNFTQHTFSATNDTSWREVPAVAPACLPLRAIPKALANAAAQAHGGGLYASVSLGQRAGVRWSRPQMIIASETSHEYRTTDHPVDSVRPPGEPLTNLLVDEGVCEKNIAAECPADSPITCRYDVDDRFIETLVMLAREENCKLGAVNLEIDADGVAHPCPTDS